MTIQTLNLVQQVANPVVRNIIPPPLCKFKISGFMRLRNEAEYLKQAVYTWLELVDELVLVYNNCDDSTAEIVELCAQKHLDRIKAFHYLPIVYPQGSKEFFTLESNDVHSLVNYYNFTLSQCSYPWAVKIDGDLIFDIKFASDIREQVKKSHEKQEFNSFFNLYGINLILDKGEYYVNKNNIFCATHGDLGIFYRQKGVHYCKNQEGYEYLNLPPNLKSWSICCYYHTKFIKGDFGISNYELTSNPNSRYHKISWDFYKNLDLILLKNILKNLDIDPPDFLVIPTKIKCQDYRLTYFEYLKKFSDPDIYLAPDKFRIFNEIKEKIFSFLRRMKGFISRIS